VLTGVPIGVLYEALKLLCNKIVVITGAIGGRGVAYHDLKHERVLTDMYAGQNVPANAALSAHGQLPTHPNTRAWRRDQARLGEWPTGDVCGAR